MILDYIELVGSTSAKDIFNQCMGVMLQSKRIDNSEYDFLKAKTKLIQSITLDLQELVNKGLIRKVVLSTGQVFYRV